MKSTDVYLCRPSAWEIPLQKLIGVHSSKLELNGLFDAAEEVNKIGRLLIEFDSNGFVVGFKIKAP